MKCMILKRGKRKKSEVFVSANQNNTLLAKLVCFKEDLHIESVNDQLSDLNRDYINKNSEHINKLREEEKSINIGSFTTPTVLLHTCTIVEAICASFVPCLTDVITLAV